MGYYNHYSPLYYQSTFWPNGVIPLLINVLVWGLVIYLIMYFVKKMSHHGNVGCCGMHDHSDVEDSTPALDIVKERYAKGEIDKKQFEELKKDLSD